MNCNISCNKNINCNIFSAAINIFTGLLQYICSNKNTNIFLPTPANKPPTTTAILADHQPVASIDLVTLLVKNDSHHS